MSEYGVSAEEIVYTAPPRWARRKPHMVSVVKVSNGAVQVRMSDGSLACGRCPFACLAAHEPCEFGPWFGES